MEPSARAVEADDRANELYWGSDRSVNQIADDLDLSKGALYGMIRPLPAAMGCPDCGAEVAHPNRTAKERALVDCPACGWSGSEDDTVAWHGDTAVHRIASPLARAGRNAPDSGPDPATLIGGALLGAAVGLALILWARRK